MITVAVATTLRTGANLYHKTLRNSQGKPAKCRVNGKCKTWKTRPDDFKLPVIHGLRDYFYIEPANAAQWCLSEVEAEASDA